MILPRFGKREKFLAFSFLLSSLFLINYLIPHQFWPISTFFAFLLQLAALNILFKLENNFRSLASLVLPSLVCLSMGFVQYLFPHTSFWFEILFLFGFFLCFYLTLLALNIFLVARKRGEIPLLRPAKTALFLLSVLIFFLGSSVILKGVSFLFLQLVLLSLLTFLLAASFFFFFGLEEDVSLPTVLTSLLISFLVVEIFLSLSFFPQKSFFRALSLAAAFYAFLGVGGAYFSHRLEKKVVFDFLLIFSLGVVLFWLFPR